MCDEATVREFISDRAFERRAKAGVSWDLTDCPITASYLDSLQHFPVRRAAVSRWLNTLVFESSDTAFFPALRSCSFVRQLDLVAIPSPNRSLTQKWPEWEVNDQSYIGYSFYGAGYSPVFLHNGDLLHREGFTGQNKWIAVFDNGFPNVENIPLFQHLFTNNRIRATYDFVRDQVAVNQSGGHGTHVLSSMAAYDPGKMIGSAPDADYMLLVTEDDAGETIAEEYHWAEAAEWAEAQGVDVFSTSLGYTTFDNGLLNHTYADLTGDSTPITKAANLAASKGVLVLNSAGNEGGRDWYYISAPADGSQVIAVGAVDSSGKIATFSGHGPNAAGQVKPDVCAQGVANAVTDLGQQLMRLNGTSFSCPVIAGLATCLWQAFPDSSSFFIRSVLQRYAHRYNQPDSRYGYGIPNLYNAWLQRRVESPETVYFTGVVNKVPGLVQQHIPLLFYQTVAREYQVRVVDMSGRQVYNDSFFLRGGTFEEIDVTAVSSFSKGMYLLEVIGEQRQLFRFIVGQ